MFIECLSPTCSFNISQAELSLITIDAVCAARNALALRLPELSAYKYTNIENLNIQKISLGQVC